MRNHRLFIRKQAQFQVEANTLKQRLNSSLNLGIEHLEIINVYDIFDIDDTLLALAKTNVFSEVLTDEVIDDLDLSDKKFFAIEPLPGQYDQRADSAMQCLKLLAPNSNAKVTTAKLLVFDKNVDEVSLKLIKDYYINKIESQEKNLNSLENDLDISIKPAIYFNDFISLDELGLQSFLETKQLAMSLVDLKHVQTYFISEKRNPSETEILMLDTYWSDHCRHTTFETILEQVEFADDDFNDTLQKSYELYLAMRQVTKREAKPITLMDMATINAKYERAVHNLENLEVSDEINACSVYVDVDNNGIDEKWLLMFKNETHNHPTEIEPFGGASTCIGGAIRDPLSGRAYVYQAMRISGSGNVLESIEATLPNKLPQQKISQGASEGNSSYGNQIGLATTYVREIYHPNYVAKHMELGAVVGAAKAEHVKRLSVNPGDIIILLGGKTGRDGVGGATGSSKEHNEQSLKQCAAEVQKGNAPEERKIQRLFRNPSVTKLIKKSNDFGAGGVSVAIGELAPGLVIDLDKIPTKYQGLSGSEIAISESQERMAVVVEKADVAKFIELAKAENISAIEVAKVTKEQRLVMYFKGEKIVDLARSFIDTNGVRQHTSVKITKSDEANPFMPKALTKNSILAMLSDLNICCQKGMVEQFDASIGASTIMMPYGGKYQLTPTQTSVQRLPLLDGKTSSVSLMAYGYNPLISSYNPYLGATYAIIESLAKIVSSGGNYQDCYFSFQEYFEKLGTNPEAWGKVTSALLGAIQTLKEFNLAAIGGKDSMSGTYKDINVPPTLVSFAVCVNKQENIISPELKEVGNYLYLIDYPKVNNLPCIKSLKANFDKLTSLIHNKTICSAYAIEEGGVLGSLFKMSFGNKLGFKLNTDLDLLAYNYGAIVVESSSKLEIGTYLGEVSAQDYQINDLSITSEDALSNWLKPLSSLYPMQAKTSGDKLALNEYHTTNSFKASKTYDEVNVFIPVFPGTNCEYDSARAFQEAGAKVHTYVFKNFDSQAIEESVSKMCEAIDQAQILMLAGGFSAGDEPDGSAKFIVNVLNNPSIKQAVENLLARDGLILGICNGFQALVKCGLLPYGKIQPIDECGVTLVKNDINRHISLMANTRVISNNSPWLQGLNVGDTHSIALSHGEGKFYASQAVIEELFANGQVAFQYVDLDNQPTNDPTYNVNGSLYAIEGIVSKCGKVLGKMGHSERYVDGNFINISGNKQQDIFKNGVNYFLNK